MRYIFLLFTRRENPHRLHMFLSMRTQIRVFDACKKTFFFPYLKKKPWVKVCAFGKKGFPLFWRPGLYDLTNDDIWHPEKGKNAHVYFASFFLCRFMSLVRRGNQRVEEQCFHGRLEEKLDRFRRLSVIFFFCSTLFRPYISFLPEWPH